MRIRTKAVLIGLLAAAVFPGAALATAPRSVVTNLDDDPAWERLELHGGVASKRLFLIDRCQGIRLARPLTRWWDGFSALKVRELDGATHRPEIWIAATRGTTGGPMLWKIVRYSGSGCPKPRTLFQYRSDRAPAPAPYEVCEAYVEPGDYRPGVAGLELRALELLVGPGDTVPCSPGHSRRLYYEYVPSLGRYSLYSTGPVEGPPG